MYHTVDHGYIMSGKLYGIGVGPGDSELLTLKAKRLLDRCGTIAYPVKDPGEKSIALEIIRPVIDLDRKEILELWFRMDPSDEIRAGYRRKAIEIITDVLDRGEDVCMVTLGDVSIFSTYMRINDAVEEMGYETEVVPGIPSFCGGAAAAKMPLVIGNEGLAIVPSAEENTILDKALDGFENIVVMKAYDSIEKLVRLMEEKGIDPLCGTVISCIGMENEYIGPLDVSREYGYFTTVVIKK